MPESIDSGIPYFKLHMSYMNLGNIEPVELPAGYSFRFFQGQADVENWIEIEISSGDIKNYTEGKETFAKYYGGRESELEEKMLFIIDQTTQKPVATAAAWQVEEPRYEQYGIDRDIRGHLHWVAVRGDYQGRGLSKPLITKTMNVMHTQGSEHGYLSTQTNSWLACKVYLSLGWKPLKPAGQTAEDFKQAWDLVYRRISK
jgi:ribosomal protein S18 acetylase RimI-like enzyme